MRLSDVYLADSADELVALCDVWFDEIRETSSGDGVSRSRIADAFCFTNFTKVRCIITDETHECCVVTASFTS